jgi:hypothetical protein
MAVPPNAPLWVMGAGTASCGHWLENKADASFRNTGTQWFLGFIGSHNYYARVKQLRPPDQESVSAFVDRYCSENPLHALFMAAAALTETLGGPKALHTWKR